MKDDTQTIAYVHTEKASHKLEFKEVLTPEQVLEFIKNKKFPHPVRQLIVLKQDGTLSKAFELRQRFCEGCGGKGYFNNAFSMDDQRCTHCKGSGIFNEEVGTHAPFVEKVVDGGDRPMITPDS